MLEAQRKGFSFQISDGLSAALTIVENEEDGEPLLDAVMLNMRAKNGAKKGSGCTYVKNLFEGPSSLVLLLQRLDRCRAQIRRQLPWRMATRWLSHALSTTMSIYRSPSVSMRRVTRLLSLAVRTTKLYRQAAATVIRKSPIYVTSTCSSMHRVQFGNATVNPVPSRNAYVPSSKRRKRSLRERDQPRARASRREARRPRGRKASRRHLSMVLGKAGVKMTFIPPLFDDAVQRLAWISLVMFFKHD